MGERKVLIRYIPPDFDPSIIPKFKRAKNRVVEVRMMLPFSMRCTTCGEYMGRGKKFNSRKEDCAGEDYMGIRRFRFIIKCSVCSAHISFKTDPKNSDYECEYGATRNYELWKDNDAAIEEDQKMQEEEEKLDAMRALENRTLDSKNEMDILDALDETMAINRRHERVDTDALLLSIESRECVNDDEAQLEAFRKNRKRQSAQVEQDTVGTNQIENEGSSSNLSNIIAKQLKDQTAKNNDINKNIATKIIPKKRKVETVQSSQIHSTEISNNPNQLPERICAQQESSKSSVQIPSSTCGGLFSSYGSSDDEN